MPLEAVEVEAVEVEVLGVEAVGVEVLEVVQLEPQPGEAGLLEAEAGQAAESAVVLACRREGC